MPLCVQIMYTNQCVGVHCEKKNNCFDTLKHGLRKRAVVSGSRSFKSCKLQSGPPGIKLVLYVQDTPQMPNLLDIWEIWRPSQQLELFVISFKLFLKDFCNVAGYTVLVKDTTACKEY